MCTKIDQQNRCRQADLNIEKKMQTKSWALRVNSTILSMVVVDAWLVFNGCQKSTEHIGQKQFYESLATELIDFDFEAPPSSNLVGTGSSSVSLLSTNIPGRRGSRCGAEGGTQKNLRNQAPQRRCKVCSKKTTKMCAICRFNYGSNVYLCDMRTKRTCVYQHNTEKHV